MLAADDSDVRDVSRPLERAGDRRCQRRPRNPILRSDHHQYLLAWQIGRTVLGIHEGRQGNNAAHPGATAGQQCGPATQ